MFYKFSFWYTGFGYKYINPYSFNVYKDLNKITEYLLSSIRHIRVGDGRKMLLFVYFERMANFFLNFHCFNSLGIGFIKLFSTIKIIFLYFKMCNTIIIINSKNTLGFNNNSGKLFP